MDSLIDIGRLDSWLLTEHRSRVSIIVMCGFHFIHCFNFNNSIITICFENIRKSKSKFEQTCSSLLTVNLSSPSLLFSAIQRFNTLLWLKWQGWLDINYLEKKVYTEHWKLKIDASWASRILCHSFARVSRIPILQHDLPAQWCWKCSVSAQLPLSMDMSCSAAAHCLLFSLVGLPNTISTKARFRSVVVSSGLCQTLTLSEI